MFSVILIVNTSTKLSLKVMMKIQVSQAESIMVRKVSTKCGELATYS